MTELKLLGLCGSLRKASTNRMLMNEAARIFGPARFEEGDIDFPLYNEDIQKGAGIPASVQAVPHMIASADAVIVATPEYNKGISGVMKNALDWISRIEGNPWRDKPVAVCPPRKWCSGRRSGRTTCCALCLRPFARALFQAPR